MVGCLVSNLADNSCLVPWRQANYIVFWLQTPRLNLINQICRFNLFRKVLHPPSLPSPHISWGHPPPNIHLFVALLLPSLNSVKTCRNLSPPFAKTNFCPFGLPHFSGPEVIDCRGWPETIFWRLTMVRKNLWDNFKVSPRPFDVLWIAFPS
jgi:hypothetical protein